MLQLACTRYIECRRVEVAVALDPRCTEKQAAASVGTIRRLPDAGKTKSFWRKHAPVWNRSNCLGVPYAREDLTSTVRKCSSTG